MASKFFTTEYNTTIESLFNGTYILWPLNIAHGSLHGTLASPFKCIYVTAILHMFNS